jgi:uncharacterized protein YaiL (DUF2058 family)
MSNSLRDQLMGLGFKPPAKPERPARPPGGKPHPGKPPAGKPAAGKQGGPGRNQEERAAKARPARPPRKPRPEGDIDLAKAYAIRAQREKDERIAAEQAKQEAARLRREARAKLTAFLVGKVLNDKDAEIARHFEYGGKIKRIYVTADQLKALNAGELGVLQENGHYLLVSAAHLAEAEAIFAQAVALRIDPDAPAGDDPYADPHYQVPDDLVW